MGNCGSSSVRQKKSESERSECESPNGMSESEGESEVCFSALSDSSEFSDSEYERSGLRNREYHQEKLSNHPEWVSFFSEFDDLVLGEIIAQGGEAKIFRATSQSHKLTKLVAKVYDTKNLLEYLEKRWPPQMLSTLASGSGWPFEHILGGALTDDDSFAFVMEERWGSLRKLIDIRLKVMKHLNEHGPPFSDNEVIRILWSVASDLKGLHDGGVLHRDIKSSNVLLSSEEADVVQLINFETSNGIYGSWYWRAPEIMKHLSQRRPGSWSEFVFTKECDIYSFGMLCYEVITGCIPFEKVLGMDYDLVLRGERPLLPDNLKPNLKELVHDCWEQDPLKRPSVTEVVDRLVVMKHHQ